MQSRQEKIFRTVQSTSSGLSSSPDITAEITVTSCHWQFFYIHNFRETENTYRLQGTAMNFPFMKSPGINCPAMNCPIAHLVRFFGNIVIFTLIRCFYLWKIIILRHSKLVNNSMTCSLNNFQDGSVKELTELLKNTNEIAPNQVKNNFTYSF